MAKDQKQSKLPVPGFRKSISKDSVARAAAALTGGNREPLTVPDNANVWVDKNGNEHRQWTESVIITDAFRSVTAKGLMDVTVKAKIRQSKTKENTGRTVYGHWYQNVSASVSEAHEGMNERSENAIVTVVREAGLLPTSGEIKDTLLNKLFPAQNSPGANSPLRDKVMLVMIEQKLEPKKDKNGKVMEDKDGEEILQERDNLQYALPAIDTTEEDEDEDDETEEDDDEDSEDDGDSDESEESEDESDEDESDEDDEDEDEEEEEQPAPPVTKRPRKK